MLTIYKLIIFFFLQQLVELSDKIGYVGTGLAEEKIVQYIRKFKLSTTDKGWRCTICQVSSLLHFFYLFFMFCWGDKS